MREAGKDAGGGQETSNLPSQALHKFLASKGACPTPLKFKHHLPTALHLEHSHAIRSAYDNYMPCNSVT